jgi:hypothetical protein
MEGSKCLWERGLGTASCSVGPTIYLESKCTQLDSQNDWSRAIFECNGSPGMTAKPRWLPTPVLNCVSVQQGDSAEANICRQRIPPTLCTDA